MNTIDQSPQSTLHVFEQDGGWQWGITCDRPNGVGLKVLDYSDPGFSSVKEARADGERALAARTARLLLERGVNGLDALFQNGIRVPK